MNPNEMQNQNPVPPANPVPPIPTAPSMEPKSNMGPVVGIIIIVIILIVGAFYFWSTRLQPAIEAPQAGSQTTEADPFVSNLGAVGSSDDLGSIEADLNATNLDGLDSGLNSVDQELQ